jgi:plasmid maintenance system antidote protein VapI
MFLIMIHCDVGKSCRAVGEEMGVARPQIMNILKRKREIFDDFENNDNNILCF